MTPRHIALLDMATDLGVWVDVDDVGWLPAQSKGGWFNEHDLILLARNLNPVEEMCTLAHELGHAVLGHTADVDGWFAQRQERAADQWAARLLVSPAEYEAAERLHGPHVGGIAHELGVTTHILATWQDLYERSPHESQRHKTPSASKI